MPGSTLYELLEPAGVLVRERGIHLNSGSEPSNVDHDPDVDIEL
jgi:hypothetical protein